MILSVRSCNQSGDNPVSSTELMGGGEKGAVLAAGGLPRGLLMTPLVWDARLN